jgi:hypothetical protein
LGGTVTADAGGEAISAVSGVPLAASVANIEVGR